ncbi:DUF1311 domain-containing protein [Pseudomonas sp. MAFF 212408]|uniref:DUF1311 domain-containing protein n=1 Tax=Pseudomonas kitaguniensis TaxID=2607908 RepID=A0A5N7KFJ8_9PSED|nr:lysozyme inhibitor LprI family protein [Pseudomonas kitaguniensis]MPR00760.1 DUF1311 domain-containing protein [Pseudomonas kitaguniensis]
MRALMVVGRVCVISCILYASIGCVFADARCGATALTNADIINCSSVAYKKIDKLLNEQYKALMLELDTPLKADLLAAQKNWIKLKDSYCEDENNAASGAEAPIESLSCETQLTSFRLNEVIYLRTGVIGDGFYKAVSIVNKASASMDYAKAVKYMAGDVDLGSLWATYAQQNCALSNTLFGEVAKRCKARMQFQMPIY